MLSEPWPTKVTRFHCPWQILPFLCVKMGRFGFYAGWKVYGADLPEYLHWIDVEDIYPGSQAMVLTIRFFTDG
jgi:uncharacterized protein (DUF3820 family)